MKYIACLCGGFTATSKKLKIGLPWQLDVYSAEVRKQYENYYLPEFVRFHFSEGKPCSESMIRYTVPVQQTISVGIPVCVKELKLYVMPYKMVQFSIQIEIENEDVDSIIAAVLEMRTLHKLAQLSEFVKVAMNPIVDVYKQLTNTKDVDFAYANLVENGNKLKIFQIACEEINRPNRDEFLFELGTLAPVGSYNSTALESTSEEYFNKIMAKNKLSVFNNWTCLSLVDTVTIVGTQFPEWLVTNWVQDYFGLIYIWQLFRKNYIFHLTKLFRYGNQSSEKLILESVRFERKYSFNIISYNFLPEAFAQCIETGLCIEEDKHNLYHILEQEEQNLSKVSDSSMNYLLFFMTCLTIFSAIYDACSLLNEILPYETNLGSNMLGYRFFSSILMTFVMVVFLINRLMKRKKM